MIVLLSLFLLFGSTTLYASAADQGFQILKQSGENCSYCHSSPKTEKTFPFADFSTFKLKPFKTDRSCSYCHVSNLALKSGKAPHWVPVDVKKIPENHGFGRVPPLIFSIKFQGMSIKRFTECGLMAHLMSPQKRYRNESAFMYPLLEFHADTVIKKLSHLLEPCEQKMGDESRQGGQGLYEKHCSSCHETDAAPVIHLGYPLFDYKYFAHKVSKGSDDDIRPGAAFRWEKVGRFIVFDKDKLAAKMPSFNLTDTEMRALFKFLFLDSIVGKDFDLKTAKPNLMSNDELHTFVTRDIFGGSCRHCHSPSAETQKEVIEVFGSDAPRLPVFPLKQLGLEPSVDLSRVLSCNPKTNRSPILDRLYARHDESNGLKSSESSQRGMPLTQSPLSYETIEVLKTWISRSCPGPGLTKYCRPCV